MNILYMYSYIYTCVCIYDYIYISLGCYVIRCFFKGKTELKTVLES